MPVDVDGSDTVTRLGDLAPHHFLLPEYRFAANAGVADGQRTLAEENPERGERDHDSYRHPHQGRMRSRARIILCHPDADERAQHHQCCHDPCRICRPKPTFSVRHRRSSHKPPELRLHESDLVVPSIVGRNGGVRVITDVTEAVSGRATTSCGESGKEIVSRDSFLRSMKLCNQMWNGHSVSRG